MKIGIIETGKPSATLQENFGKYPDMFEALIAPFMPDASFCTVSVVEGETITNALSADGWLITGSRHGAYDDQEWIPPLKTFVENCFSQQVPLIGVCFGHQIIADVMGGNVSKSNKGWGVGPQKYQLMNKPSWITELDGQYRSHAIHQDQITQHPRNSTVFASSEFCEYAAIAYGNPDFPSAISVQSHPELSADFVGAISEERLSRVVPSAVLKAGMAELGTQVQNAEWGRTFADYFQRMTNPRAD